MKGLFPRLAAAALATAALVAPAGAEDGSSRDRSDFEAAAGRAMLFEAISLVDNDPLRRGAPERREASARPPQPERRAVRVILPSPYAR